MCCKYATRQEVDIIATGLNIRKYPTFQNEVEEILTTVKEAIRTVVETFLGPCCQLFMMDLYFENS